MQNLSKNDVINNQKFQSQKCTVSLVPSARGLKYSQVLIVVFGYCEYVYDLITS